MFHSENLFSLMSTIFITVAAAKTQYEMEMRGCVCAAALDQFDLNFDFDYIVKYRRNDTHTHGEKKYGYAVDDGKSLGPWAALDKWH